MIFSWLLAIFSNFPDLCCFFLTFSWPEKNFPFSWPCGNPDLPSHQNYLQTIILLEIPLMWILQSPIVIWSSTYTEILYNWAQCLDFDSLFWLFMLMPYCLAWKYITCMVATLNCFYFFLIFFWLLAFLGGHFFLIILGKFSWFFVDFNTYFSQNKLLYSKCYCFKEQNHCWNK